MDQVRELEATGAASDRPECRHGDLAIDVPVAPQGQLKSAVRRVLGSYAGVRAATLIEVQGGSYGSSPVFVVMLDSDEAHDSEPVMEALKNAVPGTHRVAIRFMDDDVPSRYARLRAVPFYFGDAGPPPQVLDDERLLERLGELPDDPTLAPMFADYPDLFAARRKASHVSAKQIVSAVAEHRTDFALLLRTFGTEAVEGWSELFGHSAWTASLSRPIERAVAEVTPLDLIAISNPRDPLGSPYSHQLEVNDGWFDIVAALIARAAMIFVICDSTTAGITDELLAIQQLDREDNCIVVVPDDGAASHYAQLHFGHRDPPSNESTRAPSLRRRLATFGQTATSTEFFDMHGRMRLR
jgi:hypothetical protein